MDIKMYGACFAVALVGMALQTVLKIDSLQKKARAANVKFGPQDYFKNDWLSIAASILTIILFLMFLDNLLKWKPAIIDFVKILFAFVGYTGSDIASRLFSVVNNKINSIIDVKTNKADGGRPDETQPLTEIPKNKIEGS